MVSISRRALRKHFWAMEVSPPANMYTPKKPYVRQQNEIQPTLREMNRNRNETLCRKSTHVLLNGVWMVEAEHSLTDDHCLQLSAASLGKTQGHKRYCFAIALQNSSKIQSIQELYVLNKMTILTLDLLAGSKLKRLKREVCLQLKILGGNSLKETIILMFSCNYNIHKYLLNIMLVLVRIKKLTVFLVYDDSAVSRRYLSYLPIHVCILLFL